MSIERVVHDEVDALCQSLLHHPMNLPQIQKISEASIIDAFKSAGWESPEEVDRIISEWQASVTRIIDKIEQAKQQGIELVGRILDFAEHGDYSNGNEAYGVDEGRVRAGEMLDGLRKEFEALKSKQERK